MLRRHPGRCNKHGWSAPKTPVLSSSRKEESIGVLQSTKPRWAKKIWMMKNRPRVVAKTFRVTRKSSTCTRKDLHVHVHVHRHVHVCSSAYRYDELERTADGGRGAKRTWTTNCANERSTTTTSCTRKKARASCERDLPTGVYRTSSGKFEAKTNWLRKWRHIGSFDTPEQASAAYISVRKDLDDAYLHVSAVGADEVHVDAMFDEAQRKAVDAVGGVVPNRRRKRKPGATCMTKGKIKAPVAPDASIPRGVAMRHSGRWQAQMYFAGKTRYIGVFETQEDAALAYEVTRAELQKAKAPNNIPEDAFFVVRKAAYAAIVSSTMESTMEGPGRK